MTEKTISEKQVAHNARIAVMKAEGDMRRAARREAGMAKQAQYLADLKAGKAARKAERVATHMERNAYVKAVNAANKAADAMEAANDDVQVEPVTQAA